MKKIDIKRTIKVTDEYDVLVCGGGLSGVAAALAAARDGARVGLIENTGKLGGVAVTGLLGAVSGQQIHPEKVVAGILPEFISRCQDRNGVSDGGWCAVFDPEILNNVLLEMLVEPGVDLQLYTRVTEAVREDDKIEHAIISGKGTLSALAAKIFIDATGDGDLAFAAGCDYEYGREEDGLAQSATLVFRIGGVELDKVPPTPEITELWRKCGPKEVPTNHAAIKYLRHPGTAGEIIINMTHILCCDGTSCRELTRARIEGGIQSEKVLDFFRKHIPGFATAFINCTAESIGIRETRRFPGDYCLTLDDALSGRDFPDQIARCWWSIDVHNPNAVHTGSMHSLDKSFGIPYRCITPREMKNLYIAGRPISADHLAFSSSRIASTCLAVGEAAGTASVLALKAEDTRKINIDELRNRLIANGAIVDRQQLKNVKPKEVA